MAFGTPEKTVLNNRYQLEHRLGSGGMSTVYQAHDQELDRTVAIKVLRKELSSDPEFRARFRQEARAAANLSHPNIVTVHDFGLDQDQLFIVMEYIAGSDLKTLLQHQGRVSVEEGIPLLVQACAGIGYAHRAGLVHCDIKPQNILITPDRRLKVVDFGIARAMATIAPDEKSEVVWGSPQYFSPEQAAGGAPSPASDVYSLGVVMYEMLTGQLPFTASTPQELARLHREAPPPSPRRINPDLPVALEQIMLKVLSKEPSARYRTADQLGRVLVTYSQQTPGGIPLITTAAATTPVEPAATRVMLTPADTQPAPTRAPNPTPAYQAPVARPISTVQPAINRAVPIRPAVRNVAARSSRTRDSSAEIDWLTWLLGLLALIAAGGLIPFWLWVYYSIKPLF
jgi:eukaryotic-like serine/threonine-protein kinase